MILSDYLKTERKIGDNDEGSDYDDYIVLFYIKALQAQHTQNLANATMIAPGKAN